VSDGAARLDVAIVGGGLAGNLLARQLSRTVSGLDIGVFEKATRSSFKVGESLVEMASNYLIRRHGFTQYLIEHHLPKNGLRYFFDDAGRSTAFEHMSEIGPISPPFHPGFQIDRARMEADLLEMNRQAGVRVETGVTVRNPVLGTDGASHGFEVVRENETERVECRWLIDATGRSSLLAHAQDLRVREDVHRVSSVWGRFENVVDVDDLDPAFRARVRYSSRRLSTMHFWYPGYWVWFIPLRGGLTSIGVVGDLGARGPGLRTAAGFRAFLDEHAAIRSLLANARSVDVGSATQIAYGTRRFFHADRWGLTGESATAADPLYSPGSDFIALENDFLTDLIARDTGGESADELAPRCELYDRFMQFRHEAAMLLYRDLYQVQGSYEIMRLKWDLDIGCYYNLWLSPYMQDSYLDASYLQRQLRQQRFILQALRNFSGLFRTMGHSLEERGAYFRGNVGRFASGLEQIDFVDQVGLPRTRREVLDQTGKTFNSVFRGAREVLDELNTASDPPDAGALVGDPAAEKPMPLTTFLVDRPLV